MSWQGDREGQKRVPGHRVTVIKERKFPEGKEAALRSLHKREACPISQMSTSGPREGKQGHAVPARKHDHRFPHMERRRAVRLKGAGEGHTPGAGVTVSTQGPQEAASGVEAAGGTAHTGICSIFTSALSSHSDGETPGKPHSASRGENWGPRLQQAPEINAPRKPPSSLHW